MMPRRSTLLAFLLVPLLAPPVLTQGALTQGALAQEAPGGGGGGGGGGRRGGGRRRQGPPAPAASDTPRLKPEPAQRLEPGALLCRTEDALHQHQDAIRAQLDGREGSEPNGCHVVSAMTPVAVLERHGPASTEVRLPGPPEQVGWTDAAIRNAAPAR